MTKQEEIRKVIDTHVDDGCHFPDRSCDALGSGYCSSADEHYRCLMERLDKIGLAIKADRELPEWIKFKWARNPCIINQSDVDKQFDFDIR